MVGEWQQVHASCHPPFSCPGQRRQLREAPAVQAPRRTKYSKVLLSDAALEVKKFSVKKTRVSYQILGILCEIPGGISVNFNVCLHAGTRKVTSVGKPL